MSSPSPMTESSIRNIPKATLVEMQKLIFTPKQIQLLPLSESSSWISPQGFVWYQRARQLSIPRGTTSLTSARMKELAAFAKLILPAKSLSLPKFSLEVEENWMTEAAFYSFKILSRSSSGTMSTSRAVQQSHTSQRSQRTHDSRSARSVRRDPSPRPGVGDYLMKGIVCGAYIMNGGDA